MKFGREIKKNMMDGKDPSSNETKMKWYYGKGF
jgi:hypothetical protein